MQEHPVPQNITSYEFHLIGNMTIKQFFELGAGGLLAFMSYSSNLPGILKWPLTIFFVLLGVAFAFIPLEERPLDHWFLAFLRAIYNPTKFYWKKTARIPEAFSYSTLSSTLPNTPETTLPRKRARAAAYFQSITQNSLPSQDETDLFYQAASVISLYDSVPASTNIRPSSTKIAPEKPSLHVEMHNLHAFAQSPISITVDEDKQQNKTIFDAAKTFGQSTYEGPVAIPSQHPIHVELQKEESIAPQHLIDENISSIRPITVQQPTLRVGENLAQVQTNTALPFPKTPTTPNLVVGMILDQSGKMIDQCIIEIQDHLGMPLRALRSNKLGQFFVSTPLPSGEYNIVVEKDGYSFDTMRLSLHGAIVSPL
ncbi:MAG: PrgI family protein [Candidatus Pacebacteria bacterium]|nr:PrgI family protein [Candidatus Paceibacterota bacterium]